MSINGGNFALESACEKTINKTNLLYDEIWKKTIEKIILLKLLQKLKTDCFFLPVTVLTGR